MKRIITIALCVCSFMGAYARSVVDTAKWEANIKLVFAQQLTQGSLYDITKYKDALNSVDKATSIDSIKAILQRHNLSINVTVCEVVDSLKIHNLDDKTINNQTIEDFVDSVFINNNTMQEYVKKRKEAKTYDNVRENVINAISNVEKPKVNIAETREPKAASKGWFAKLTWEILCFSVLGLLLLLAIGRCIYLSLQLKHAKEDIIMLKGDVRATEKELERKREQYKTLQKENSVAKSEIEKMKAAQRKEDEEPITINNVPPASEEPTMPVLEDKVLFVGLPDNGVCGTAYEAYRPGKTIYQITDHREGIGDLEFVCQPEAINIAKNSKTTFLHPACTIENDIDVFTGITMVKKGKVRYENEQWTIVEKAVIRLS